MYDSIKTKSSLPIVPPPTTAPPPATATGATATATSTPSPTTIIETVVQPISRPEWIYIGSKETEAEASKRYKPIVDVSASNFKPHDTVFKVFGKNERNKSIELVPTPELLCMKYFSESIIAQFVLNSNRYRLYRMQMFPHLDCWKMSRRTQSRPLTMACVYQFLAIIYYMGLVRMPDKDDYWSNERWLPLHEVCTVNGMTRNRFRFIWRNFHLNHEEDSGIGDNDNSDSNEDDEEDDLLVEIGMERVEVDQENELEEANGGAADDEDDEDGDTLTKKKDVWFDKIAYFVDHFRDVSESLIFTLGTLLAIDEMIIRFTGRSAETHRIKNKPIGKGYNFFVLTTFFGFIVNFTPDGRKAARENTLEYTNESGMGKIESMIMYVLNVIHRLKKKQRERFLKKKTKTNKKENEYGRC